MTQKSASASGLAGSGKDTTASNPANLGNLKAGDFELSVSSPPYASARIDGNGDEGASGLRNPDGSYLRGSEGWEARKSLGGRYGDTEGQIANDPGSFWDASREIVEQVYKHLLPGGVAVWVTKSYVLNKEVVDFPGQWRGALRECRLQDLTRTPGRSGRPPRNAIHFRRRADRAQKVKSASFFRRLHEAEVPRNKNRL